MELTLEQALQKGVEAHKAGKFQEADRYYTAILKVQPKHPDVNHNMGILAVGAGKVEEGLPFFKTALEANPSTAQFWLSYIDALIKLDRIADAKAVFDQAKSRDAKGDGFDKLEERLDSLTSTIIEEEKDQTNILDNLSLEKSLKLAKKKAKDGLLNEAKRIYRKILVNFPKNKRAKDGLKLLSGKKTPHTKKAQDPSQDQLQSLVDLYNQGKLQEAFEYSKGLARQYPNAATVFNIQGVVLQNLQQFDLSIEAFNKAISIKPDYSDAYYNLGAVLRDYHKFEEAIEAYKKAISIKPDYAEAYNRLGNVFKAQGKLADAIDAYTKSLSIHPNFADACYNMGNVLKAQGKLDEAIAAYQRAASIKPDYAEAYYNMGNSLREQRKLGEAVKAYKKALGIRAEYIDAIYNMGNSLRDQGHLEEAIEVYIKAVSLKADYAPAWHNLFYPLQAIKAKKYDCDGLKVFYPPDNGSNYGKIALSLLDYKLHRGQESQEIYFDKALKSLSNADNITIQNPAFNQSSPVKPQSSMDNMAALVHFGRSGTGLMHSLIDGHPQVSTLPSIYLSEYFDHATWEKIISGGWDEMVNRFISIYDVLFDATSSVPIETTSKKLLHHIGFMFGMANVGDEKNEALSVDRAVFGAELKRLMVCYDKLDAFVFFKLVHKAHDVAINDTEQKDMIFYHIHNPDTYAQLNFTRFSKNTKWVMMVREPVQSCESWIRDEFSNNDMINIATKISHMLIEVNNPIFTKETSIGVRLEDLKEFPKQTIAALCAWLGIEQSDSLYEMTAQGKKWWGDPASPDYEKDGMNAFGKKSITRRVGSIFSEKDRFILRTLFYPFSVRFSYSKENLEQFKVDLKTVRPLIDKMFDFEKSLAEKTQVTPTNFMKSGSYLYLRSNLIERWNTLNLYHTYPKMIKPLKIN